MKERAVAPSHALLSIIYYVRQKLYHCLGCLAVLSRRDDEIQLYTTAFSSAWIPKEEEGVTLRKKMHPQPQTTERHWNREVLWEIRKRGKVAYEMGEEFAAGLLKLAQVKGILETNSEGKNCLENWSPDPWKSSVGHYSMMVGDPKNVHWNHVD